MGYVFPTDALQKFDNLKNNYEATEKVDLSAAPKGQGMFQSFGATDVVNRRGQILFLQKIRFILKQNMFDLGYIQNPDQDVVNLHATRALIAACLYVESQIPQPKTNSTLFKLINSALGITQKNKLSKDDKKLCYQAAEYLFSNQAALNEANELLTHAEDPEIKKPISQKIWDDFQAFIKNESKEQEKKNPYGRFPVCSLTKPLFGAAFSFAGASVGYVAGDFIGNATKNLPVTYQLTAIVGSSLVVFGPAGSTSVQFIAPIIASKLMHSVCRISMASIMGACMEYVGVAVGVGVGLPFDLAWKGIKGITGTAANKASTTLDLEHNGLHIEDGNIILGGTLCTLKLQTEIPQSNNTQYLTVDEEGYLCINNIRAIDPKTKEHFPRINLEGLPQAHETESSILSNCV